MRMTSSTEVKCGILRTTDDKIWLLLKKASCSGTVPSSTSSSKTQNAARTDNDEVIYHPKVELWHHCLLRGANLGSFVSFVFGTPVLLYKGVRQPSVLLHRLAGISTYGVGFGVALAAVMTISRTWGNTDEQFYDRAYRLRFNQGQVLMDKVSYAGMIGGGVAGGLSSPANWLKGGTHGACLGLGLAVIAQMLLKPLVING